MAGVLGQVHREPHEHEQDEQAADQRPDVLHALAQIPEYVDPWCCRVDHRLPHTSPPGGVCVSPGLERDCVLPSYGLAFATNDGEGEMTCLKTAWPPLIW